MTCIDPGDGQDTLSDPVDRIARGLHAEIATTRSARPAARLVPIGLSPTGKRIGRFTGRFLSAVSFLSEPTHRVRK